VDYPLGAVLDPDSSRCGETEWAQLHAKPVLGWRGNRRQVLGLVSRVVRAGHATDIAELTSLSNVGLVYHRFSKLRLRHRRAVHRLEPRDVAMPAHERKVATEPIGDVDPGVRDRRERRVAGLNAPVMSAAQIEARAV